MAEQDKLRQFISALRPEFTNVDWTALARKVLVENPQQAWRELPGKLQASRDLLAQDINRQPGQPINPQLMDQFMNLTGGFAPMGITKAIKPNAQNMSDMLPATYDDVTQLPIPKQFGGVKTEDYLFHGGVKGKLQNAPVTSFSKSPQEALEYTTISGGDMAAIPKSALNIYKGTDDALNKAIFDNDLDALKRAGYDGADLRSVYPGGYREVIVWNLEKALDKALYAPVSPMNGTIGIKRKLQSLLD